MASAHLLRNMQGELAYECPPLQVSDATPALLGLLRDDVASQLRPLGTALDLGQRPLAWVDGDRLLLGAEDRKVDSWETTSPYFSWESRAMRWTPCSIDCRFRHSGGCKIEWVEPSG